jgi:hypothetical protein
LELGTAKVDITPRFPVPLAGFATRTGVFDGVLAPLFARIFCWQCQTGPPVILVSADLIWWGSDRMQDMRHRIRTACQVPDAAIVLHATHNHSGPQAARLSPLIGEASPAYVDMLEETVVGGIRQALANPEPVHIARATGQCRIGIHRRRMVDGAIRMAPNPGGPNDPECTVIRFQRSSGSIKALLVHFTCHPTTTAVNSVSAEFCGAAMTAIEGRFGNDVIAGYLQGCCGDIRPALIREDEFYRGDIADVQRLGAELSQVVSHVLAGPMQPCATGACSSAPLTVPLFFEEISAAGAASVPLEMMKIMLGPDLGFLTFSAEMVVEYGLHVKRHRAGAILPVAYTNGMIGYVTTGQQLAEGGYESREAFRYFEMPAPFAASTESRVLQAIDTLLNV